MVNAMSRPLYRRERVPVATIPEAGRSSVPVWTAGENLDPTSVRNLSSSLLWNVIVKVEQKCINVGLCTSIKF